MESQFTTLLLFFFWLVSLWFLLIIRIWLRSWFLRLLALFYFLFFVFTITEGQCCYHFLLRILCLLLFQAFVFCGRHSMPLILCTLLDELGLAAPLAILFISISRLECLLNFVENRSNFLLVNLLKRSSGHVRWCLCPVSINWSFLLMSFGAVLEILIVVFLTSLSTLLRYCIGIAPLNQLIFSLRLILLEWASFSYTRLWTLF